MTQNNNFMSLYGFAFVIFGLRRISFDITSQKQKIHVVFVKKHCELSCCTIAITLLSSPWEILSKFFFLYVHLTFKLL